MSQSGNDPNIPDLGSAFSTAFSLGGQVAFVNIAVILIGLFIGIKLDSYFGTKPTFILIFVLGSVPFSLVLTYFLAKHEVNKISQPVKREESLQREEKHSGE